MFSRLIQQFPLLSRFIIFIVPPIMITVIWVYLHLTSDDSFTNDRQVISGLTGNVTLTIDASAIPHINASNDKDAYFTLGYMHAKERLWQMEAARLRGQGRLSELYGQQYLADDIFMRTLGIYRYAKANVQYLNPESKATIDAYAKGVNAWIAEGHPLPAEYYVSDLTPEPWKAEDTLVVIKLLQLSLAKNYLSELATNALLKQVGQEKLVQLFPHKVGVNSDAVSDTVEMLSLLDKDIAQQQVKTVDGQLINFPFLPLVNQEMAKAGTALGSNAWVVSGGLTASGKPMVASDPHLTMEMPSLWYLADIKGDKLHVAGATIPGAPIVMIGRTENTSWGITALTGDVQDLYIERINPNNDNQYEVDGKWHDMEVIKEEFRIKPEFPAALRSNIKPVKWSVRLTHRGPVISDVMSFSQDPVSLAWTALHAKDKTFDAMLNTNYADSVEEFRKGLVDFENPAVNYLVADNEGNIARFTAAKLPVRHGRTGVLPAPGWVSNWDWNEYIPFDQLPHDVNPASGYIVQANNKNHADAYPHTISTDWAPGYRAERIEQFLAEKIQQNHKLTTDDFRQLQGDVLSLQAVELLDFITSLTPKNDDETYALTELKAWNGDNTKDSIAPAIYNAWLNHFNSLLVKDEVMGNQHLSASRTALLGMATNRLNPRFIKRAISGDMSAWCDTTTTEVVETCNDLGQIALTKAMDELVMLLGKDIHRWRWQDAHPLQMKHGIFKDTDVLKEVFNREVGNGGNEFTLNVSPASFSKDDGYVQVFGPTYRQVVDLGKPAENGFISNSGQSGNALSKHYDDFIALMSSNELINMQFDNNELQGTTVTLTGK